MPEISLGTLWTVFSLKDRSLSTLEPGRVHTVRTNKEQLARKEEAINVDVLNRGGRPRRQC